MATNIIQRTSSTGPVSPATAVDRAKRRPAVRRIVQAFNTRDTNNNPALSSYIQHFLAARSGYQGVFTQRTMELGASRLPLEVLLRAADAAADPQKIIHLAIFQLGQKHPSTAALKLDRMCKQFNLDRTLRGALFDAISHGDPEVRVQNLHTVLFLHADQVGEHAAFESQIQLAHWMLEEDHKTFEAINENWNKAMKEASDANKKQAERNAIQAAQIARQQQNSAQLANSEKAAKLQIDLIVSASLRAKIARLLRLHPTAEKTVWTSASVEATSPVEAASSSVGVEQVQYKGANGQTETATRHVSVASTTAASNFASGLRLALDEPDAAAAGVNIGLGMGGHMNRAIAVR